MNKYKILCVISAREGSKGIKNKNIIDLYGKPLIAWSILHAKKSKYIDEVYVSTDSPKIAKISKSYGAKVPFLRSKNIATRDASKFLVWKDALKKIEKINKTSYDFFFDLDCTNPLRSYKDVDKICKIFLKKYQKFDGIYTISKARKNPYFNVVEQNRSLALEVSKKIKTWPTSRQSAPKVYDQVASMYLFNSSFIRKKRNMYDGKICGYELKDYQNYDIDSELDFFIIKKLFKKYYFNKN